jgi:hypothetical protein
MVRHSWRPSKAENKEYARLCSTLKILQISKEPRFRKIPKPAITFPRRKGWLNRVRKRNLELKYIDFTENIEDNT